jgi:SAM-dependent methyltransferase
LISRVRRAGPQAWQRWADPDVVDVGYAAFAARTYVEQRDLRRFFTQAARAVPLQTAADVGCGYGRLSPVLAEVCREVVGFEREPEFVRQAQELWPSIEFRQTASLARLPARTGSFDFVLTFTVLQHLIDTEVGRVAEDLKRVLRRPGFLLLCEETDQGLSDPAVSRTIGRSVERYQELLAPLELVETAPRRIEPTYSRPDVGTYMLFSC